MLAQVVEFTVVFSVGEYLVAQRRLRAILGARYAGHVSIGRKSGQEAPLPIPVPVVPASWADLLLRPLLALIAAGLLGLGALTMAGWQADALAREEEGRRLAQAIQLQGQETLRLLEPFAVSDEAALNLHAEPDPRWAQRELARHMGLLQQDVALLVRPDGFLELALAGREVLPPGQAAPMLAQLAPAIAALRGQRNAHRPQATTLGTTQGQGLRLLLTTRISGRPAQVALATIIPATQIGNLPPPPPPIVVMLRWLDSPAFLRGLSSAQMLAGLRVAPVLAEEGLATLTLPDATGAPVLRLAWDAQRPGAALRNDVLPFVWASVVLVGLAAFWSAWRLRRSVRALAAREREAAIAAHTDALTGLPNRRALLAEAPALIAAQPMLLMVLDFDRFKRVNMGLGHAAGDRLLAATAQRLGEWLRDTQEQARLYRLEGDQFVLLQPAPAELPAQARGPALRLFARLRRAVRQAVLLEGGEIRLDVSAGMVLSPAHGATLDALLRHADAATHAAKREGRGRALMFEPRLDRQHEHRLALEAALLRALREGLLHVHYQPQFDARTGALRGAEALVRWDDPRLGAISPAEFIPLAEEMGVISDVALLVLRQAVSLLRDPAIPRLSVNLSVMQLRRDGFLDQALSVLAEAGVPPARIEFEVTEGVLVEDTVAVKHRLDAMRAAGFALALDDFGTGFSALAYLRLFRFDRLKIDRSFIRDLGQEAEAAAVVSSVINLGHGLGLEVVAEGVEAPAQLAELRRLGCDLVQGYLTGAPMPPGALKLLAARASEAGMRQDHALRDPAPL